MKRGLLAAGLLILLLALLLANIHARDALISAAKISSSFSGSLTVTKFSLT